MANAKRDANYVPTLIGVSSIDLATPTLIAVNPLTGAILIDGTSLYTDLDTRYLLIANNLSDLNNTTTARTNLGLGSIATQNANNVSITGGSITGITDLAVADGGTGKSSWTQYLIPYADTTTSFSQIAIGTSGQLLTSNGAGVAPSFQDAPAAGANTALSNLASVAINTSLVSDADSTDNLGSTTVFWANTYTDTLVLSAGLVGTPALTFTGDLNTGIYSPAADRLSLVAGGALLLHSPNSSDFCAGLNAGNTTMNGGFNTCIGVNAGNALTSGNTNTFIGRHAGAATTTGGGNIFIGYNTGISNISGSSNIYIGTSVAQSGTATANSVFIGNRVAASGVISGSFNTMVGDSAGSLATTGNNNTYIGAAGVGRTATTASDRTMIGQAAGYYSTGINNTFIGSGAGQRYGTGTNNTIIGVNSGTPDTQASGSYNIFIGEGIQVGTASATLTSSIGIGYKTIVTANNQLVIGSDDANGSITAAYFGQGVTKVSPAGITFNATGGSGTDNAGAPFTFAGGQGTGTGAGGDLIFQYAPAGSTGSGLNSLVERLRIGTAVVFNDGGNDVDFRVESDNAANLLFLDAGADTGAGAIGFFGTAAQVQQATIADADGTLADVTAKLNTLLADLEGYGLLKSA